MSNNIKDVQWKKVKIMLGGKEIRTKSLKCLIVNKSDIEVFVDAAQVSVASIIFAMTPIK